jgi:hypothetical protein
MTTTAQIGPPRTSSGRGVPAPASERPAFREMLAEIVPLIDFVPFYGPPAIFLLGPWLFLVLMLAGPFACLVALLVVMVVVATVVAALAAAISAIVATPYRLVRHLRGRRKRHASLSAPSARVVAIESPRVAT